MDPSSEGYNNDYLHLLFSKSSTRANLNPDGSGSFSEGDKIGLYINNGKETQYRVLTYNNGQWHPLLRRSEFGSGSLTFSAHYPVVSDGMTQSVDFQIDTDQSELEKSNSDLLFANTILDEGKYEAVLSFKHLMHRLKIELEESTKNATILIRSKTSGNINLLDGTVNISGDDFQWITPAKGTTGDIEAIIFPQPTTPYRTEEGLLKILVNQKEMSYAVPEKLENGQPFTDFETGKETTIRLKSSENIEWANKKMWVYGVQAPEDDAWKYLFPTINHISYLNWDEKYGWYDINKRNPSNLPGGVSDGMMCWAASASNLIHWWIDRNKAYVDKYIEQGKYRGPGYQYNVENAKNENKQESEIFQVFLNSFQNEAGNIDDGINWFIHGIRLVSNTMRDPINNAGYFKDVFPEGIKLSSNIAGMGKETFNKTIKDALVNKKAIGVNVGKVKNSHAITIWGAEFDENGDVSYIYLADNNDRNQFVYWGYGCMKRQIVYIKMPEGGTMAGYKKGDLNEPEDSYIPINRLFTLELGTKYFEEYFKNE